MIKEKIKKIKENKVVKAICNFLNKDNYIWQKIVILIILSGISSFVFEHTIYRKYDPQYISNNRMMLVAIIFMFIGIHFIIRLNKLYNFIHKYRYPIAGLFMVFVMLMGYHGSSILNYDNELQLEAENRRFHTLLGTPRLIRTDEWASSMMYKLSQGAGEVDRFEYFNDNLRGTETDMFTLVDAPVKSILMIGKPLLLGFLFLGNNAGLSFYWYGKLVLMLLGAYELCRIISNDNRKVSLVGAVAITFSAAVQWWYCMDTLIWGQLILVLVNKFMKTDKKYAKYLCALGLVSVLLAYIFVLYPAWQVPFVYALGAIFIYMFVKNLKEGYKFTLHDVIVILLTILVVAGMLFYWYNTSKDAIIATMSTDYPGQRRQVGGGSYIQYAYIFNMFFPYQDAFNPCETSSMLSFYPLPMIFGLVYMVANIKNKDKKERNDILLFLIPILIIGLFLTVWCTTGVPEILAKLTLMSMSTSHRVSIALGALNIYILIYLFSKMERKDEIKALEEKDIENKKEFTKKEKILKLVKVVVLSILAVAFTVFAVKTAKRNLIEFLPSFEVYLVPEKIRLSAIVFAVTFIAMFNMDKKFFRNTAYAMIIAVALVTGIIVNPVSRTADIIYEKPICKKFAEIRKAEPDAIWLGDDTGWYLNNYMVGNGLRVINSTNVYPNFDLFEAILGKEKAAIPEYNKEYNRYCHVNINLGIYDENQVTAVAPDNLLICLNTESLKDLGVDYILAKKDINEMGYSMEFEEIYYEDGLYIFKPIYE